MEALPATLWTSSGEYRVRRAVVGDIAAILELLRDDPIGRARESPPDERTQQSVTAAEVVGDRRMIRGPGMFDDAPIRYCTDPIAREELFGGVEQRIACPVTLTGHSLIFPFALEITSSRFYDIKSRVLNWRSSQWSTRITRLPILQEEDNVRSPTTNEKRGARVRAPGL